MTDLNMKVRSTPPEEMSPNEKLFTAISIVQAYILAEESNCFPDKMFGNNHLKQPSLEMVERLLMDIVPAVAGSPTDRPATDKPEAPSRILELFREHRRLSEEAGTYEIPEGADADKVIEALFWDRTRKIEQDMMELPSESAADFAAKVLVDTVDGSMFSNWDTGKLWKEARELVGMPDLSS